MKILCTGDVHIGRRSSRIPSGIEARTHASGEAWSRIVDLALAERVDVVTISGDLVDESNRFFEAFGPVERGIRRLREGGVVVVAVAGNHDHEVLPRIFAELDADGVHLLGRGGDWERVTIERGGVGLHVDGWSFPRASFTGNPLATYSSGDDGTPVLALVHGDLDQPRSPYAPLSTADLRRHPHVFFQLGHVHSPRPINEAGGARALYPGSPQALDPGEPGPHGVFLLETVPGGFESTFVPVSTVRYERVEVPVSGYAKVEEVETAIVNAVRGSLADSLAESAALRHLLCRVALTGTSPVHRALDHGLRARVADLQVDYGTATATVEALELATRPARDLSALASMHGAPGVLARLLARLDAGEATPADEQLLRRAVATVRDVNTAAPYLTVLEPGSDGAPAPEGVRGEIARAAGLLLDELLSQREPGA